MLSINEEITARSKIKNLCPVLEGGFLRIEDRIKYSDVGFDKKYAIILSKSHPITDLVIREYHTKMFQAGTNATLYAIRERYWIIDGGVAVRRMLNRYVR